MNAIIETLNHFGGPFLHFAWPMFWQSSLLIAFIFALDVLLARKMRASIRYALWMAVLVKLLLPPTLALPTGAAWWLTPTKPAVNAGIAPQYVVTYGKTTTQPDLAPQTIPIPEAVSTPLNSAGWALLVSCAVSLVLLLWLARNWWQVARKVRGARVSDEYADALEDARQLAGLRSSVRLKIVEGRMSPAVCGLIRPVILLPRTLLDTISAAQLRAVLLHELFHLRRRDVWVNCAQALLQIAWWWHPLLWLANARMRRLREEAVDDAVMLALREDAESYAPTLIEVAKLAFQRPLMSLGLVGIMESRSALRQRIERLVDYHGPRKPGLTFASLFGIFVFSAVALPMGEAPTPAAKQIPSAAMPGQPQPSARKAQSDIVLIKAQIYQMAADDFDQLTSTLKFNQGVETNSPWWSASREKFSELITKLESSGLHPISRPRIQTSSGVPATMFVGNETNGIEFACSPFVKGGNIDLAIQGSVVDTLATGAITNQFNAKASAEDQGGIVIRNENLRGSDPDKMIVVVIGVQIVMDGASKNATAMTFRLDTGVARERLEQMKLEAGVNTPPAAYLYLDNGFMFARGTGEQPALDNHAPQQINITGQFVEVPETFFTSVAGNPLPAGMTNGTGILTEVEARTLIQRLKAQPGADVMTLPNVTSLAGRQVKISSTQIFTALTNAVPSKDNSNPLIPATMQSGQIETGPVLDVIAEVLADDYTIDLRTIASVTEFLGYADGTNMAPQAVTNSMPVVRLRTKTAHTQLFAGQTQVLFPTSEKITLGAPDKNRDAPVAEYIRQVEKRDGKKILIVFVTPTLIDPAGNRVYSDDDAPMPRGNIPAKER